MVATLAGIEARCVARKRICSAGESRIERYLIYATPGIIARRSRSGRAADRPFSRGGGARCDRRGVAGLSACIDRTRRLWEHDRALPARNSETSAMGFCSAHGSPRLGPDQRGEVAFSGLGGRAFPGESKEAGVWRLRDVGPAGL